MSFTTKKTSDDSVTNATKTLLVTHHGWGKTYQCRFYQEYYGPGLILSGESGLKSIEDVDIDYIPFTSWDGAHDPEKGVYSFKGIVNMMLGKEFQDQGYKWIAIDSLTEMSDRLMEHLDKVHEHNKNNFEIWADYKKMMVGSLKWIRDLPMNVLVTSLAAEEEDDNGMTNFWPMVQGNKVAKQIPGLFDHVLCGKRVTIGDQTSPTIERYIITDEVKGWHGKVRDPHGALNPVEKCDNVTDLFERMKGEVK